jgi:hypothetical protein
METLRNATLVACTKEIDGRVVAFRVDGDKRTPFGINRLQLYGKRAMEIAESLPENIEDLKTLANLMSDERVQREINYLKNVKMNQMLSRVERVFAGSRVGKELFRKDEKDEKLLRYVPNPMSFKDLGITREDIIQHLKLKRLFSNGTKELTLEKPRRFPTSKKETSGNCQQVATC